MLSRPRPRTLPKPTTTLPFRLSPRNYATAAAIAPSPTIDQIDHPASSFPIQRYPPTQPPSHKPPFLRKSQLHRQYASLLRSSPLLLFFQHNNLRASEWAGIRRELAQAMKKSTAVSEAGTPLQTDSSEVIRLQIIQTGIFSAALRVVEFYKPLPTSNTSAGSIHATAQASTKPSHLLSTTAYNAVRPPSATKTPHAKRYVPLHRLLHGPLCVLPLPSISPTTLTTILRILSPTPGSTSAFPAPRRKDAPGLYEAAVQSGLAKLVLLGARVEGRGAMDGQGVRWVGGLPGVEGLRGELVRLLLGPGMGVTGALEGQGRSLYGALEGRRLGMIEEAKGVKVEGST